MSDPVCTTIHGTVGVIHLDNPPVNALGHALRTGIQDAYRHLEVEEGVAVIVIASDRAMFSAGADVSEFGARRKPYLTDVIDEIEAGRKPVVAVLNGYTFGGALELALACDYRHALPDAQLALPEIRLGLIPGAGGTQKLPRLIGAPAALDIVMSGRRVAAPEALTLGMVDHIAPDADAALREIADLADNGLARRRIRDMPPRGDDADLATLAAPFLRKARGAQSMARALEAVSKGATVPIDAGQEWERETFTSLNGSEESRALQHAFFAERKARKIDDIPADTALRPLRTAAVIGAGTMGTGIAITLADAGIPVTLIEQDRGRLEDGLARLRKSYDASHAKGRIDDATRAARVALVDGATDIAAVADADIVIEAVFEAMDVKREVFAALDRVCKPRAILATNTSTLDVNTIAAATDRPADVIGLHFFSPANIMKLLEVVRGDRTGKDVVASAMALGGRLGKVPVQVGVCDGFAGNRMFINFNREAQAMVEQGALPWQVDKVLTDWGLAMGPFAVMDLAGLDVGYRIREARAQTGTAAAFYPFTAADRLAEAGRHGQKTGRGWYLYPDGARKGTPDPEVETLIVGVSQEKGIQRREVPNDEILHRCLWQLVVTGCRILEEGIAQRASDLDVIFLNGYGFPRTRGGPMHFAESVGLPRVLAEVERYHAEFGERWQPPEYLKRAADAGTFDLSDPG